MIDGLTSHYLIQQGSEKAMIFLQMYQANMADILWDTYRRADNKIGNDELVISVTDGGSNKRYKPPYPDDTKIVT